MEHETQITCHGVTLLVTHNYHEGWCGTYLEPEEPEYCEVTAVHTESGDDITYFLSKEALLEISSEVLEQFLKDTEALNDE